MSRAHLERLPKPPKQPLSLKAWRTALEVFDVPKRKIAAFAPRSPEDLLWDFTELVLTSPYGMMTDWKAVIIDYEQLIPLLARFGISVSFDEGRKDYGLTFSVDGDERRFVRSWSWDDKDFHGQVFDLERILPRPISVYALVEYDKTDTYGHAFLPKESWADVQRILKDWFDCTFCKRPANLLFRSEGKPKSPRVFRKKAMPSGRSPAERFRLPKGYFDRVGGSGDIHVVSDSFPDTTLVLDLSRWPPKCHVRKHEWACGADSDQKGRWLLVSRVGARQQKLTPCWGRRLSDPRKSPESVLDAEQHGSDVSFVAGFLVAGRGVLVPDTDQFKPKTPVHAWMQHGNKMEPVPSLPPHTVKRSRVTPQIVSGIARLPGGSEILVWDGEGYEWDGRRFRKTFALEINDFYPELVPAGNDGFYYINRRKLFEIHPGRKPVEHAPKWNNIMGAMPGPSGGILLLEGGNPDGDIGKLYFPVDKTFIHIGPELLGNEELYDFLCWSRGANRIIAGTHDSVYAVPVETVLSLPRAAK
jgi:hypothetical protein